MAPRLSGQKPIFGVVFVVSKSPLGIEGQKTLKNLCNFDLKASELNYYSVSPNWYRSSLNYHSKLMCI